MSNVREENIRLRIQAASDLPTVSDQLADLIKLQQQLMQTNQQYANQAAYARQDQTKAIQGVSDALQKQKVQTTQTHTESQKLIDSLKKGFNEIGGQARDFASLIGIAFSLNEIKQFGLDVIDAKTKIDSLKIALDVMLGSKKASADLFNDIVALAKQTPFSLDEVAENVVKLKAYNVATKDLVPTVEALGNMAAAVGKEKLPQLTLAYGQVMNLGKLMGTELRQFVEAGIPLYDLLADSMKKPKEEVIKLANEHKIMASDVQKAVMQTAEAGGRYYNMMRLQAQTLGGQISNLGDTFLTAKARIGDYFEDGLKGGIKILADLLTALAGNNAAIQRTTTYIASAVAALTTWKLAVNAQAIAATASNLVTSAGTLITGTYNLAVIAAKGTTEGFTRAQLASAVAARSTWAALAANPIGAVVALIGVAATAFLAFKAANVEVTEAMGEQQYQILKSQGELARMGETALATAMGTKQRKEAIDMLIAKYPEYFSGINSEKINNVQLKKILDEVNNSYEVRAKVAKEAYTLEKLNEKQRDLWDQQAAAIKRMTDRLPELKKFGNDGAAVIAYLNKNIEKYQSSGSLSSAFDNVVNGNPLETLLTLEKNLKEVDGKIRKSEGELKKFKDDSQAAEITAAKTKYAQLISDAAGNSKEILRLRKELAAKIEEIEGKEIKATIANLSETKAKVSQTYIEIQELRAKQGELTLKEQARMLDLEQKLRIESIQDSERSEKAKQAAIIKVVEEYAPKRAAIETKITAEAQKKKIQEYTEKEQELQEKIAVITAQRLEMERISTKLSTAKTQQERLAIWQEYGKKITDDVKAQGVEQLRIQMEESKRLADLAEIRSGIYSVAAKKANDKYLNDQLQYLTALASLEKEALQDKVTSTQQAEKQIQALQKQTAEREKEHLEDLRKMRGNAIKDVIDMFGQANPILTQFGGTFLNVLNNIDQLSGKSKEKAESELQSAKSQLAVMEAAFVKGDAMAEARIEKLKGLIQKLGVDVNTETFKQFESALGIFGQIYQVAKFLADAWNKAMKETYQAIADAFGNARKIVDDYYTFLAEKSQESLQRELEVFQGTYAEKEKLIRDQYEEEVRLAEGKEKLDAMLGYQQALYQAQVDADGNVRKLIEGTMKARMEMEQRELQAQIDAVNRELEMKKQLHEARLADLQSQLDLFTEAKNKEIDAAEQARDTKAQILKDELDAFKAAKQGEIDALNESLAQQKAATDQFFSDKQLRLQEDDVYRSQLLAQGEAREVAALEAARDRELQRAQSAEERTNILNAFEKLIAEKHAEYQDAVGNKTKEISLANQETKAQENEKVKELEKDTADAISVLKDQIAEKDKETQATIQKNNEQTATEIQRLKDEIAAKDKETNAKMADENKNYAKQVILAEYEIANIKKAMIIAELRAEQAMLRGKRWFLNKNKVDSAISDIDNAIAEINGAGGRSNELDKMQKAEEIQEAINQANEDLKGQRAKLAEVSGRITAKQEELDKARAAGQDTSALQKQLEDLIAESFPINVTINMLKSKISGLEEEKKKYMWTGTEYLDGTGYKKGIDTIPVMMTEGERILSVAQNKRLGKISNDDLVEKMMAYDRLMADFPQILSPDWASIANTRIALPAEVMNYQQAPSISLDGLRQDLMGVRQAIEQKELLQMNVDANGFAFAQIGAQSKTQRVNQIMTR